LDIKKIPRRAFLDTCVVNFILEYSDQIHDNWPLPQDVNTRTSEDIHALRKIFIAGSRGGIQFAVSPFTYSEIAGTQDSGKLSHLHTWFQELWQYWRSVVDSYNDLPNFIEADDIRVQLLISEYARVLPDLSDRILLCDALVYRCDLFCTRDWNTILKHRKELSGLPIKFVTPSEFWALIQPFAFL